MALLIDTTLSPFLCKLSSYIREMGCLFLQITETVPIIFNHLFQNYQLYNLYNSFAMSG